MATFGITVRGVAVPGVVILAVAFLCAAGAAEPAGIQDFTATDFDRHIAPIIADRCMSCHSGDDPRGMLDLSLRDLAMQGGDSGVVIQPGHADRSLLWQYIESDQMPPKKPLSEQQKALLRRWIDEGAIWGTERIDPFRFSTDSRAGSDWWSLQPLSNPTPPDVSRSEWIRNPIDAFVLSALNKAGLSPSPEADKRTLIRRLSFDLLGLPPTPQQVDAFLTDTSDDAYTRLVERLLASPHYGERWARHWLDIVRFGESNGFEYDQPRDHAWPYRDWVIRALNDDMPYDQFVRLQLAGDVIRPDDVDAAAAAGFLVAGPHNTTLPSNDLMRKAMAQDELEDLVGIVSQTFLGLTANCARCHDHKFDPISQQEYYQLAATLTGVRHGERVLQAELSDRQKVRLNDIDERISVIRSELRLMEQPVRDKIIRQRIQDDRPLPDSPQAFAVWEFDDLRDREGSLHGTAFGGAATEKGALAVNGKEAYVATSPLPVDLNEKTLEAWVRLDQLDQRGGGVISVQTLDGQVFDAIVFGERDPGQWMAGSNSFVRTKSFQGESEAEAADHAVHVAIVYHGDGTITGYRNGKPYGNSYRPGELQRFAAGNAQVIFGLRHSPAGGNRMLAGRIERAQLHTRALTAQEVAASAAAGDRAYVSEQQLFAGLTAEQQAVHQRLKSELSALLTEKEQLLNSRTRTLYTTVSTDPGISRVLLRGDAGSPGMQVAPTGLSAVTGVQPDFGLAPDAGDGQRRRKLADWIAHQDNPLFSRVMVNRLWQFHFGRGLVTTSSDFGFNGGRPSHPELLDWLARTFRDGGFRLKAMHRLMVLSATYRQSALLNETAAEMDADNRLLWRRLPQRLEAEEIRDAILLVTGQLDPTVGGQGYRDVNHVMFKGSNFYESIDEPGTETHRRTIYRFSPRGGHNPLLDTFDCPDPSVTTPQRAATTTPLQALALMNNTLIFRMADAFAARVLREAGESLPAQISLVYRLAWGREPVQSEIEAGREFARIYGMASFCRVVLNSNEFLYVR